MSRWSLRVSLPGILLLLSVSALAAAVLGFGGWSQAEWARYALMAMAVLSVLLLLCGLRVVYTGVLQPVVLARGRLDLISKCDLSFPAEIVSSRNEVGSLLNSLKKHQDGMARSIHIVRRSLSGIGSNAQQIVLGNSDLSGRTDQQAASLQQAAASMEELASTVKQNADNARQANQLAVTASEVAQRGGQAVGEVVSTMQGISASSRKIADIVGVIDSIAFQTNILALNAAVEAARAGEQGKGFAVVASEVRALAQRSAQAAREIKDLIEDSVRKVSEGSEQVERAGATMDEIVSSVARVTDIMGEISAATVEQSSGIDQINIVVSQIDNVTRQNAQLVEQAAGIGDMLRSDVEQIKSHMNRYVLPPSAVIDVPAKIIKPNVLAEPQQQVSLGGQGAATSALPRQGEGSRLEAGAARGAGRPAALPAASQQVKRPDTNGRSTSSEDDWEEF
ncbi:methyl-accepting chemotaxis protein [Pusillimonas sp. CC-YST705]|uniref:Methyl-accepting chemotaxis protein n=1 Tax=Mesopusillimonas faecipullorum TaxID=2755040 RepID=A0ABS8CAG1_9BURK|nr:methyl-accepting chemotaxis protein [Mesopusillimonas faecipullorum]MCB5362824.1 methyl-accepting chemotaxis protein [Mesopusillimonas faecipullorum]